ncbi:UPF0287-domain-containing protein [Neoconidiobolus thromboides FSU 785]|nr:UPF0287-domain-containing protein [Neoconidiobolus thromboides FSU 785]
MHPTLTPHKHTECISQIMALNNCHLNHPIKKYFGECNDLKIELNKCLALEFEGIRSANAKKAKDAKKRREELWKEFEDK